MTNEDKGESRFAIVHIPHASTEIPFDYLADYVIPDEELQAEILRATDHFTDRLFDCSPSKAAVIVFPVSRLVVDPVIPADAPPDPAERVGMSALCTTTCDRKPFRILSDERRKELLERYHRPHHARLNRECARILAQTGKCLFIDCRSFPSVPLPGESGGETDRPDICIGKDPYHTPDRLAASLKRIFQKQGFKVSEAGPLTGTFVPSDYHGTDKRVAAIGIGVNRSLYMNEKSGNRTEKFLRVRFAIHQALGLIIDKAASL